MAVISAWLLGTTGHSHPYKDDQQQRNTKKIHHSWSKTQLSGSAKTIFRGMLP